MRILVLGILAAGVALLALACGRPEPTPTATATSTVTPVPAPLSAAHQLFINKGCAACHGQNAEGTEIAPPLAGHSAAQVKRQVRAPLGIMPVFPPDKVSNQELGIITEYIDGLQGEHMHVRASGSPDEMALHHWMALFSIEAGDASEGKHHLGHIVELTKGEHLAQMKKAMVLLEEGSAHEAAHIVERMLAGLDEAKMDETAMHLTLALSSARVEETAVSMHHVVHFIELASGLQRETAEQILSLLGAGEVHNAVNALEELWGEGQSEPEHGPSEPEHLEPHQDEHDGTLTPHR